MKTSMFRDPNSGGIKIPETVQERTRNRILRHAAEHYAGKYTRIEIRFRGAFCYIDAYTEPNESDYYASSVLPESREEYLERLRNTPTHLCRLRYFGDEESWSFSFYTYSRGRYELSYLNTGDFFGTPEEAFETSSVYLQ